jgi:hypothetical protein
MSASNERLDFALAEFDAKEPQSPASAFAMPSIRAADAERDGFLAAGDISAVPRSSAISAPGRVGEFVPLYEQKNIKISGRWESHRMTLHQNGRLASKRRQSPNGFCWIATLAGSEAR